MKCAICNSSTDHLIGDLFDDRYGAPNLYSVYECQKCGFGRIGQVLSKKEIGQFYKKYYPLSQYKISEIKSNVKIMSPLMSWLFGVGNTAHWQVKQNSTVLDIGSGSGRSLLEIRLLGGVGYGVEPDPSAQRIAKKLGLNVFKGFLSDNPFPKNKFDYITGSQVIEHEPDPVKFLKIAKGRLDKNGLIVLSFPNFDSVYRKLFGRSWINWHVPYHINFFSKKSLEELAKKTGLKIVDYKTITPNIWTVIQVRMLFSESRIGQRNKIWNQGKSSFALKAVQLVLFVLFAPINRLVDSLGMGDSILVNLAKEE